MIMTAERSARLAASRRKANAVLAGDRWYAAKDAALRVVPRLDNDLFLELKPAVIEIGKLICYSKMTEGELLEIRNKYEMLYEFIARQLTLIDDALTQKASTPAS